MPSHTISTLPPAFTTFRPQELRLPPIRRVESIVTNVASQMAPNMNQVVNLIQSNQELQTTRQDIELAPAQSTPKKIPTTGPPPSTADALISSLRSLGDELQLEVSDSVLLKIKQYAALAASTAIVMSKKNTDDTFAERWLRAHAEHGKISP